QRLEDLPLLSLAAIHGVCLGGGIELALACTRRIASDAEETRLGFPEVLLGILPAWGGTTRLPRLIGLREASRMILSGKRYSAREALAVGLLDEVLPAQGFKALALEYARGMVTGPFSTEARPHRIPSLLDRSPFGRRIVLGIARRNVMSRTHGHYPGPEKVLDVLGTSWKLPLPEALAMEARAAGGLIASPASKNLIHLFHLREDARKGRGISEEVLALPRYPRMNRPPDGREEGMVHRILEPYLKEARILRGEGFGKRRIEAVARGFGMESGPFDLMKSRNPPGRLSRNPPGRQSDSEIRDRLILVMVTEAASILEEGGVSRAGQIDLALIIGAGFPPFRGGLLRYVDHLGLPALVARLRDFAHRYGPRFGPAPLLLELARTGGTFYTRFP
ncbi:MAG: enoyl-CoA hydratase-related protein, partial [Gemmatimonadota bacterium]